MLVTETEAHGKWCSLVNNIFRAPRDEADGGGCIAARCMMWRERGENDEGEAQGYCGLAGPVL
jgi:hypothetical protein